MNFPIGFRKTCRFAIVVLAALAACAASVPSADAPIPQFTKTLFDGRTLDGWTVENDCEAVVEEGLLVLKAGDGWIRSDHTYANFLLHVEWKALKTAEYDAGVFIRTLPEGKPFPTNGYQVNLLDGKEGNISNIKGAASSGLVKRGEWNEFDITAVDDTVSLVINGKPAYNARGLARACGFVGLQCEVPKGGQFTFRNLKITELGFRSLFNGRDLAGWDGAGAAKEKCWQVRDALIECTGAPGPWLRSAEEFDDFNLRLEYLVSPAGNSGVYVRVPPDGNHHRDNDEAPAAGLEVQILDDAAEKYRDLKDYQFSASVYDIAGANPRVSRPAGKWNTLEINTSGQHVAVTHNGQIVVNLDEDKYPLIRLRQKSGFLGLQNHSTTVAFRNLRIGPPLPFPAAGAAKSTSR